MTHHRGRIARRAVAAGAALVAAGLLAACSSGQPADSGDGGKAVDDIRLSLDWSSYVAYHAPFEVAADQGIWKKYDLNVTEDLPGGSGDAVLEVGTGKSDIAWADLSTAAASMLQGVPITAVAKIQEKNASGLTVLDGTKLDSAKDVVGMRIGSTPGGSDSTLIGAFLKANGITEDQVKIVNYDANSKFPALMTGDVDAISGQVYFYTANAEAEGKKAKGLSFTDMGLNVLDHGFVASDSFIEKNPDAVTRFLQAYQEALQLTIDDPAKACEAVVAKSEGTMAQDSCETQLDLWLPLVTAPDADNWGESSAEDWKTTVDVLKTYGGATGDREAESMFTNDLLPSK